MLNQTDVEKTVAMIETAWGRFKATCEVVHCAAHEINQMEIATRKNENALGYGSMSFGNFVFWLHGQCDRKFVRDTASRVIHMLAQLASEHFAAPAAKLEIDQEPIKERFMPREPDDKYAVPEDFSPRAIWAYLQETYGEGKGADLACEQAARLVVRRLRIKPGHPLQVKGGKLSFEISIYGDSFNHTGRPRLSMSDFNDLKSLACALVSLARERGRPQVVEALANYESILRKAENGYEPRDRFGNGDLEFTLFTKKAVVRFSAPAAAWLNEVISSSLPSGELAEAA